MWAMAFILALGERNYVFLVESYQCMYGGYVSHGSCGLLHLGIRIWLSETSTLRLMRRSNC